MVRSLTTTGDVVDIPTVKSDSHDPSTILPLFSLPSFPPTTTNDERTTCPLLSSRRVLRAFAFLLFHYSLSFPAPHLFCGLHSFLRWASNTYMASTSTPNARPPQLLRLRSWPSEIASSTRLRKWVTRSMPCSHSQSLGIRPA